AAADLSRARIQDGEITGCSLKAAKFKSAVFDNYTLANCNLAGADIEGAKFAGVRFLHLDFSGVFGVSKDFPRCTFDHCKILRRDFAEGNLNGTHFISV